MGLIIDLDQTIIDTRVSLELRQARKWSSVYKLIPEFKVYNGMVGILTKLRSHSVRICIVTSSPTTYCTKVLQHWSIPHDFIVCYQDTSHKKPHPEPILLALYQLMENERNVISAGDKDIDIIASRKAKVKTIGCMWGSDQKQSLSASKPDYLAKKVTDFQDILYTFFKIAG